MNIRQNVQDLLNKTSSKAVKEVCEKYLQSLEKGSDSKLLEQVLVADLEQVGDPATAAMLTEIRSYSTNIMAMQNNISKSAAQKFAEWGGMTTRAVSNVGELKDNTMITEASDNKKAEAALVEGLRNISDHSPESMSVVEASRLADYGVSKGIDRITKSKIFSHPSVKYAVARIQNLLESGTPEYQVVREFVSSLGQYNWDNDVKIALSEANKALENRASVIEVQEALANVRQSDRSGFYSEVVTVMNEWLGNDKRNNAAILRDLKPWVFHPSVKNLCNKLSLIESNSNGKLNLPVSDANCKVNEVYSPVLFGNGSQIFKAGSRFFRIVGETIKPLSESQVNALPASYHSLCEKFFSNNVRVVDGDVIVYMNKNKVRITSDKKVLVNENRIDPTNMGHTLLYYTNANIFGGEAGLVETCISIYENIDTICEIDYAKQLVSNLYEGLSFTVIKKNGKVYVNRVNEAMNEDKFFEAKAVQAIKIIKETLGYDISESFFDILEGEEKQIVSVRKEMDEVLDNIKILEGEIKKIERAVLDDPYLSEVDAVTEAKASLEQELGQMQSKWQRLTADLKEAEEKPEITAPADTDAEVEVEIEADKDQEDDEAEGTEDADTEEGGNEEDDAEGAEVEGDDVPPTAPTSPEETPTVGADTAPVATDGSVGASTGTTVNVSADAIQQSGLLGAAGVQDATIKGNDNTGIVSDEVTTDANVADAGFMGAEGNQQQTATIPGGADILNVATGQVATETGALPIVAAQPEVEPSAPAPEGDTNPDEGGAEEEVEGEAGEGTEASVDAPEDGVSKEEEESEEEEGVKDDGKEDDTKDDAVPADTDTDKKKAKSELKESIKAGSKVKIEGTENIGEVQSVEGDQYLVVIDGKPQPFKLEQLQDLDDEIAKKEHDQEGDEAEGGSSTEGDGQGEGGANSVREDQEQGTEPSPSEGEDKEVEPTQAFIKAKITINFGDFKQGDSIMIDAAAYAKGGDEDPIPLQDGKGTVTSVPKKYIEIEDVKTGDTNETLTVENSIKTNSIITSYQKMRNFYGY